MNTNTKKLADRLRELSNAVTKQRWSEFSMRVPAEPMHDADLVLTAAAGQLELGANPWRPLSELPEHGIVVVWDSNGVVYSQHCHTIREQIREGRTPPLAIMLIPDFKGFGNG